MEVSTAGRGIGPSTEFAVKEKLTTPLAIGSDARTRAQTRWPRESRAAASRPTAWRLGVEKEVSLSADAGHGLAEILSSVGSEGKNKASHRASSTGEEPNSSHFEFIRTSG